MINIRTIGGVCICALGIVLNKLYTFSTAVRDNPTLLMTTFAAGLAIVAVGLYVFTTGLRTRVERRIRVCTNCYFKNDATRDVCAKCGTPLPQAGADRATP